MSAGAPKVLALAGGVGGAKLALGLSRVLGARLTVVGNTGDDETFYGLHVSPDLDTLMYTLAGVADPQRGWGLEDESFACLEMLGRYDEERWFNLGDRDMATHILRTRELQSGSTLSETTGFLAGKLGVPCGLFPMSDEAVRTEVDTVEGRLAFQDYFVKKRCEPRALNVEYAGAGDARMSPGFSQAVAGADALVYCPSNPVLSLGPILAVGGAREALRFFPGPRVAVSPIVGAEALRGPAAKLMKELGEEVSVVGVARRMEGLCDILVIDTVDRRLAEDVEAEGLEPLVTSTVMETIEDKERLAGEICDLVGERLK